MSLAFASGDVISLGSATSLDDLFNGGATMMAWVNPASSGGGSLGRVFDKTQYLFYSNNSSATNAWTLQHLRSSTTGRWNMPANSVSYNTWQHVVVAYDGSSTANNAIFYKDGVSQTVTEDSTPAGTIAADAANTLYLGNRAAGDRQFDGRIVDARAYNRILTANEIATIYACRGHDGIVSGLVGRWKCDELSPGTTASGTLYDSSPSANHGTPSGAPTYQDHPLSLRRAA
jgi:hypothetical protein